MVSRADSSVTLSVFELVFLASVFPELRAEAPHFTSTDCLDLEASNRQEATFQSQGHTPFGEAFSDSPLGADSETVSWPPPISTQES
jgi:hypothetical protein